MLHDLETDRTDQRRDQRSKLDVQASLAHDLMLALMDFAAAQASKPLTNSERTADLAACQTCAHETRRCVMGFYVKGLRGDFNDEAEIGRLRRQGCLVQVVEADQLEAFAPNVLGAVKRANRSRT